MTPHALIVHTNRDTAELGREILDSSGFECRVATGVEEAVTMLNSHCPQVLLIDRSAASTGYAQAYQAIGEASPVLALAAFETLDGAISAMRPNAPRIAIGQILAHHKMLLQSFGKTS